MKPDLKHEKDFSVDDYEGFYEHHYFKPLSDDDSVNAHRIFPRVAWALDIARETQPKTILDLGCLEGFALLTVASHTDSVKKAVGVDLSEEATDLGKSRVKKFNLEGIEFHKDSIEHYLEGCKEEFDLVMLFEVMEHVKDPELVLKLVDKVLNKRGTVLISTPAFESPTFGKDDEQNKCHIRLYTLEDEDYEAYNKFGTLRKATALPKHIGKHHLISADIFRELIHARYQ